MAPFLTVDGLGLCGERLEADWKRRQECRDSRQQLSFAVRKLKFRMIHGEARGSGLPDTIWFEHVKAKPGDFQDEEGAADEEGAELASYDLEELLALRMMDEYFRTRTLLPQEAVFGRCPQDEELYLSSAIGVCRLLEHYAKHVASTRPEVACAEIREIYELLVQPIQGELLRFDFRNGPLRRKYDAVKYVSKTLEELIYQLSFFSPGADALQALSEGAKASSICFEAQRIVLEKFNETREDVIKKSRDITKAGKQAIYALLRGNMADADRQLRTGETVAREIAAKELKAAPDLRTCGSYSGGLEELGEAAFLRSWLKERKLVRHELLNDTECLGALADFTGEVHRWAVAEATQRRTASVREAVQVVTEASEVFLELHLPGRVAKKARELQRTLDKEETLLFELLLSDCKKVGCLPGTDGPGGD